MTIEWLRDLVIVIYFILFILVLIGILVGVLVLYFKTRKLVKSINKSIRSVHKWVAYVMGLFKGLNESVNLFSKGGS
jgi:hypothetical protein